MIDLSFKDLSHIVAALKFRLEHLKAIDLDADIPDEEFSEIQDDIAYIETLVDYLEAVIKEAEGPTPGPASPVSPVVISLADRRRK